MTQLKSISIILTLFMFFLSGCNNKEEKSLKKKISSSDLDNKIILEINKKSFLNRDFKGFLSVKYKDLGIQNSTKKYKLLSRLFDTYVDNSVLLYTAEQKGITISDDDLKKYTDSRKLSIKDFNKDYIKGMLQIEKLLYSEIYRNITVSENEIRDYYKNNPALFDRKSEIELYQIFLKKKDEALKVRGQLLNSPKLFDKIAHERANTVEGNKNGYIGNFQKGELPLEMESVVFSLKPNQISRIVQSKYGFHIFKVKKIRRARHEYLKNVHDKILDKIKNEKISNAYKKYISQLKKNSNIKIKYENLYFKYEKNPGETNEAKDITDNTDNTLPVK